MHAKVFVSVLLLMINCIIILSVAVEQSYGTEPQASGSAANYDNVMMNLSSIRGQMHKKLMSICFLE